MTPDDAFALWKIMSDSRVPLYTGDTPWTEQWTVDYNHFVLSRKSCSLKLFLGACILKDSQTLIGLTGLYPHQQRRPEIEWQFGVSIWGKGYATEIGQAVVTNASFFTYIEACCGIVNPPNLGSIRVMRKIGMTCLGLLKHFP